MMSLPGRRSRPLGVKRIAYSVSRPSKRESIRSAARFLLAAFRDDRLLEIGFWIGCRVEGDLCDGEVEQVQLEGLRFRFADDRIRFELGPRSILALLFHEFAPAGMVARASVR